MGLQKALCAPLPLTFQAHISAPLSGFRRMSPSPAPAHFPAVVPARLQIGTECEIYVQDASAFAGEGEALSFAQLQARVSSVRQVLMAYYRLPSSMDEALDIVINPQVRTAVQPPLDGQLSSEASLAACRRRLFPRCPCIRWLRNG